MSTKLDLVGKRFGRLTVISFAYIKNYRTFWKCHCDCGNDCIINGKYLSNGDTVSCGCRKLETGAENGKANKKCNKIEEFDDYTKVYFNNNDKYFLCDKEDWEKYKHLTWFCTELNYARAVLNNKFVFFHDIAIG